MKLFKEHCIDNAIQLDLKMKLSIAFLFLLFFQVSASTYSQNTKITLNEKEISLKSVINKIEKSTDFKFFFENRKLNLNKVVTVKVKEKPIRELLNIIFIETNVQFEILDKQIILTEKSTPSIKKTRSIPKVPFSKLVMEQMEIKGIVADKSGMPLPGVSIVVKGTSRGVQTDFDGKYQIQASQGETLDFSYIGMETQSVKIGVSKTINIVLKESATTLGDVVVVAYGTSRKEAITGSIASIGSETIEKRTITNVSNAIEGSTTGVIVTSPLGQPGAGQKVVIRGFGSFGSSNEALYVVDGIPISGNSISQDNTGGLSGINPSDIESITILKDAGSTALYGNKAANGVVLITTKSGKTKGGELNINVSTSIITRGVKEYDRLGPRAFYEAYWDARRNAIAVPGVDSEADVLAASIVSSEKIYEDLNKNPFNVPNDQIVGVDGTINPNAQLLYPDDLDWEDAITRTGIRRTADLSFNTRTEKGGFFGSLGYLDEEGYLLNSDFNRVTGRANGNLQATSWLRAGINISGAISEGNQAQALVSGNTINPFRFIRNMGSIYPIYQHDPITGAFILDENGERIYDLDRTSGASNARHIVHEIQSDVHLDEKNRLDGKTFFEIKIAEGLTLTNNMSFEVEDFYQIDYRNTLIGDAAPNGDAGRTQIKSSVGAFNQLLRYDFSLKSLHNFDLLAGHESQNRKRIFFDAGMVKQIFNGNIELANFVTQDGITSYTDKVREESYLGRFNYNYDNKYFLSASIRTDGISKFDRDYRWGTFYSIGGSWNIDNEDFIASASWINNLKIRASHGELGNANLGFRQLNPYLVLYDLGYNNQDEAGVLKGSWGAPELKWEKSAHTDVALEFGFWNRLRGSVEYFNKKSEDLIFDVPLPLSAGGLLFDHSKKENIGELFNRGWEVSLSYDIIKQLDYSWSLTVNASTLKNEITKLPEGQDAIVNDTKRLEVGSSLFDYYIRDWYGVDPADGSGLYVAEDATASEVRIINGVAVTPRANNAKRDYLGSVIPDAYGSISSNLRYKNFNFDFLFTYQIGGENLDNTYGGLMDTRRYGAALHADVGNRWRKPGDITDVPRADAKMSSEWQEDSDRFLVDASYLSLRQINLSYNLPESMIEKIGMSNFKIYANAENVFNINARRGFNQQQNFDGDVSNVYIPSRVITFGINTTF